MHYDLPDFPVIVIHLEDPPDTGIAACCGKFIPIIHEIYRDVPMVLCEGCRIVSSRV